MFLLSLTVAGTIHGCVYRTLQRTLPAVLLSLSSFAASRGGGLPYGILQRACEGDEKAVPQRVAGGCDSSLSVWTLDL